MNLSKIKSVYMSDLFNLIIIILMIIIANLPNNQFLLLLEVVFLIQVLIYLVYLVPRIVIIGTGFIEKLYTVILGFILCDIFFIDLSALYIYFN